MINISQEVLDDNLAFLVAEIESEIERSDEGGRIHNHPRNSSHISSTGSNSIWDEQYLLPSDTAYHELSITTLRKISIYLCDALIRPKATIPTTFDHLCYWGWTAAVAGEAFDTSAEEFNNIFDFQLGVHLGLLPMRLPENIPNATIQALRFYRERLMLLIGFSTLEGLICEFNNSLTGDGKITTDEIKACWKPERIGENQRRYTRNEEVSNYHDLLQIWRTQEEEPELVRQILYDINDLQRYDIETLLWKFEDIEATISEELTDSTHNFLRIIGKHRNKNYHGEQVTRTLAPVILTLCCLAIWDNIEEEEFIDLSSEVYENIQWEYQTNDLTPQSVTHPLWPSAFYPVK